MGRLLMDIWGILEIEPTEEVGAIKKAYAKKLKLHHPEEDPTGYQILREAYDKALKLAKNKKVISYETSFELENDAISTEEIYKDIESRKLNEVNFAEDFINEKMIYKTIDSTNSIKDYNIEALDSVIEDFFYEIHNLYKDFHKRVDVKNWSNILNADILWNLNYKNNISKSMLNFIFDYPNIPKEVWLELNKTFHWSEKESYLRDTYNDSSVDFLLNQIGNERGLRYEYLSKKEGIDYDTFLKYRQVAFDALKNNDLKEAENYISLAYEIFQVDPDLICMKAEVYVKKNKLKMAESIFTEAINISDKDNETAIYILNIYYNNGYYDKAISFCKSILKVDPNNIELKFSLGKVYLGNKEFKKLKKAQYIFLECLNFETQANEARKYINLLIDRYETFYNKEPWNLLIIKNLKKLYLALGKHKKAEQVKFKPKKLSSLIKFKVYHLRVAYILLLLIVCSYTYFSTETANINISVNNTTAKKIEISWNKVKGADTYNVYRYDDTSKKYILVGETKDTKFVESKLVPDTQFTYKVASIKYGKEDIVSDSIKITTEANELVPISKNEYSSRIAFDIEKKKANYGNRGNNLVNAGLAVGAGDWFYYTDKDMENSLYRAKKDGTIMEKLHDGFISNLNIVGDWIYFTDNYKICKIKTDGSGYKKISDNIFTGEFIIIGDWIYFESEGLNKMMLDGSHRSKIIDCEIADFNINGDWIYFSNINDKNRLYKVRIDGSKTTKLSEDTCGFINISDGWIYYKNFNDSNRIYKIKLDCTNKSKVTTNAVNYFNVIGDIIIYEGENNLSKVTIGGENETIITDTEYNCINIVDDYIFCYNYGEKSLELFILKFEEATSQ